MESATAALTAAALYVTLSDGDTGMLGLLVTPLLAATAGMIAARLLVVLARGAQPRALRRGKPAAALALAQLGRRPELFSLTVLVTVAASLLTFGVAAWDVADRNRQLTADDEFGAHQIYRLAGVDARQLMDAVEDIDPDGESLLAAVRTFERYNSEDVTVVSLQTDRLASVVDWRGHDDAAKHAVAQELHPQSTPPLIVKDELTVEASAGELSSEAPLRLVAQLAGNGDGPVNVRLGDLVEGDAEYTAELPACPDGCRLVGLGVSRSPADFAPVDFSLRVASLADAGGPLEADLGADGAWRSKVMPQESALAVAPDADGLRIEGSSESPQDLIAEHAVVPAAVPTVLSGDPIDESETGRFTFPGPHGELQDYELVDTAASVPRGGNRALLVDLEYTAGVAETYRPLSSRSGVSFEIWAGENAPEDLTALLREHDVTVTAVEARDDYVDQLDKQAPALALRLYVMAGAAALALAAVAVLLAAQAGRRGRGYDYAALRLAGVPPATLRDSLLREHLGWIAAALAVGVGAGLAGVALLLPRVPLVTTDPPVVPPEYQLGPWWLPAALIAMTAALA
ncbi:MAG: hypothetical protein ACRDXX_03285, partial [Stackebrandtia sp.]